MKNILFVLMMILVSTDILADVSQDTLSSVDDGSCSAIACAGKITNIVVFSGGVRLKVAGNMNDLNCTLEAGQYIFLQDDHQHHQEVYSFLLSHYMADKPLRVRISEESTNCRLAYVSTV